MPIRPEYRKFYGASWRAYRAELLAIHGNVCSACGRRFDRYLNLSHVSHDPRSSEVRFLCMADHNRHDAGHRLAIMRRNRAKRYGQLWLWVEVQHAPYPAWLVPRPRGRRADERQESLFG